jgi:hypothetical protein
MRLFSAATCSTANATDEYLTHREVYVADIKPLARDRRADFSLDGPQPGSRLACRAPSSRRPRPLRELRRRTLAAKVGIDAGLIISDADPHHTI